MTELSETEQAAFDFVKEKGEVPINQMPHKLQGAVGKLISLGLLERFRKQASWEREDKNLGIKKTIFRMTNWVRVKE